uniref:Uncharacterized protein n=1 Tax=Oncorhynchus tshawytscha TaxID=74940 RepID=A0A8C8CGQ1_ONCTS
MGRGSIPSHFVGLWWLGSNARTLLTTELGDRAPAGRKTARYLPKSLLMFGTCQISLSPFLHRMWTMETFYWEEDALLYIIVHDHQAYAQYLLSHYTDEALLLLSIIGHDLVMAVRNDRRGILGLILQEAHRLPSLQSYMNRGGCFHMKDGKTPLHLACELLRSKAFILLLGNGASPLAEDHNGVTPLDVLLGQLWDSKVNIGAKNLCLDNLLMFIPKISPLFVIAMQKYLRQLPPEQFPDSLDELPIPSSLKPLPCQLLGQLNVL